MSFGRQVAPVINSTVDYQNNLASIEKARQLIEEYAVMNEEAKSKFEYEQDLAHKIAEGERARQELEQLRSRNALAVAVAATVPTPQSTAPVANTVYVPTTARIEEVPHGDHNEQRNIHPSTSRDQGDRRRVHVQEPYQHSFFTSAGVPQEQQAQVAGSNFQYYRPEVLAQSSRVHHVAANQPLVQPLAPQPARPSQAGGTPSQGHFAHQSVAYAQQQQQQQQQLQQLQQHQQQQRYQQHLQLVHPTNVHHGAPIAQPTSRQDRSQQIVASARTENLDQGRSSFAQVGVSSSASSSLPVSTSSSSLMGALESASHSKPETRKNPHDTTTSVRRTQAASYSPPQRYIPTSDAYLPQFAINSDLLCYYAIPATQYVVYKRLDHSLVLALPNGKGGATFWEVKDLVSSTEGTNSVAPAPSKPEDVERLKARPTATQPTMLAPMSPSVAIRQHTTTQESRVTVTTPVSTAQATLPQQSHRTLQNEPHLDQENAPVPPSAAVLRRTPADADKKRLARDILRALSIKRLRPPVPPGSQTVERPAKRHAPEPVAQVAPLSNGEPNTQSRQPIEPPPPHLNASDASSPTLVTSTESPAMPPPPPLNVSGASLPTPVTGAEAPAVSPPLPLSALDASLPTPVTSAEPVVPPSLPLNTLDALPTPVIMAEPAVPAELVPANSSEFLAKPESNQNVGNVVIQAADKAATPIPMDVDATLEPSVYSEPIVEHAGSMRRKTDDDAANELGRLSIQEPAAILVGTVQVPQAPVEELEEGQVREIDLESQVREIEVEECLEDGEVRDKTHDVKKQGEARVPSPVTVPPEPVKEARPANKMPLFLPSPSSSPQRIGSSRESRPSSAQPPPGSDEDISMIDDMPEKMDTRARQLKPQRHRNSRNSGFYILVPPPPPYVRRYREQEARQRKRRKVLGQQIVENRRRLKHNRSPCEDDTTDPLVQSTIANSATRLAERRCKWGGCDAVLNSSQNLFEHLRRSHLTLDYSKRYIMCYWTGCGDHVPPAQTDEHLASHTFFPLLCAYQDCDESFRVVQPLIRHNDTKHGLDTLKSTPEPFVPSSQEPPSLPGKVPAYLIKSGLVRQEPISPHRHYILGPWVYNNIAGPVKVTKRYNAAKHKPVEYAFQQSSSMQFSTNPSQPARLRDMGDLRSVEVSEMISEGLVIWPPSTSTAIIASSSEEDELGDEEMLGANQTETAVLDEKALSVVHHSQSSEEDAAVETMLTGQLAGSSS